LITNITIAMSVSKELNVFSVFFIFYPIAFLKSVVL